MLLLKVLIGLLDSIHYNLATSIEAKGIKTLTTIKNDKIYK
jgi:hypothetical protein